MALLHIDWYWKLLLDLKHPHRYSSILMNSLGLNNLLVFPKDWYQVNFLNTQVLPVQPLQDHTALTSIIKAFTYFFNTSTHQQWVPRQYLMKLILSLILCPAEIKPTTCSTWLPYLQASPWLLWKVSLQCYIGVARVTSHSLNFTCLPMCYIQSAQLMRVSLPQCQCSPLDLNW